MITRTYYEWSEKLEAIRDHVNEHGHTLIRADHVTPDGFPLGKTVAQLRTQYARGTLSARRIADLDATLHWVWSGRDARWSENLQHLVTFVAEHDRAPGQTSEEPVERKLAVWLINQRVQHGRGQLVTARVRALDSACPAWRILKAGDHGRNPIALRVVEGNDVALMHARKVSARKKTRVKETSGVPTLW